MANAKGVLIETVEEMGLLANSGGTLEELRALANLARDALRAGDGEIPDDAAKILHPTHWDRLGIK